MPNKPHLDVALLAMELLTIVFGIAYVWTVRHANWHLKSSAVILSIIGVVGCLFYSFPMDPIGTEMTRDGQMHLVIVSLSAFAAISAVLLAAMGWTRMTGFSNMVVVSWVALIVMVASGLASGVVGVSGQSGTGVWERLNTAAFLLWQITTAIALLRAGRILSAEHRVGGPSRGASGRRLF